MHHPWRRLRDRLPDWEVVFAPLPVGVWGHTDTPAKQITVATNLSQAERRCTIDHECDHAEAGDVGPQPAWREAQINEAVARRLVPLAMLLDAFVWAHDMEELADECWVDVPTMRCRLETVTDLEREALRQALRERDWHDEGRGDAD